MNLVTYNKEHLQYFMPPEKFLLTKYGKTWDSEPMLNREDLTGLVKRVKVWERKQGELIRSK